MCTHHACLSRRRFLIAGAAAGLLAACGSGNQGGGKTVTTLTHLTQADVLEPVFPALVLGPKRVIQSTWPDEVAKWSHTARLRVAVVSGSRKDREAALRQPAEGRHDTTPPISLVAVLRASLNQRRHPSTCCQYSVCGPFGFSNRKT